MYKLGAILNEKDNRDIQLAKVQPPVALPYSHITDISWIPVLNQGGLGSCVGHAHALIHIFHELKENGVVWDLSPRYLYALSKKIDGYLGEGTMPRITAGIEVNKGCADTKLCPNDTSLTHSEYIDVAETDELTKNARPFRIKNYAFPTNSKEGLKQAIVQNGLVPMTISVGNFENPILPGTYGLHRVLLFGYQGDRFFYRNSWGKNWGDGGNGYFDWGTQQLYDLMTFLDLPNEVLEDARNKYQFFSQAEVARFKLTPELWRALDKARKMSGIPYVLTSGFRTPEQNKNVGGKPNSAHLRGLAADIRCRNPEEAYQIVFGLQNCGTSVFIEIAKKHIHVDIDPSIHSLGRLVVSDDD